MSQFDLNIVIIGAGNLATHLAKALHSNGFCIKQIYSKSKASAAQLANQLKTDYTTSTDTIKNDADIYFFAIKDSILPDFLKKLPFSNRFFVHTAGSVPLETFAKHSTRYGVFYPMQTFSKDKELQFTNVPVFIEAKEKDDLHILQKIGEKISTRVLELNSEQRKRMHVAAVFTSNFTNHMYALAEELMSEANLDFDLLHPLIQECASKATTMSPRRAQTGPAVRYDHSIIDSHLALLTGHTEMQQIYQLLSHSIHQLNKNKDV